MTTYDSNMTPAGAMALLGEARRVAIMTHTRPDGDAVGSAIAIARLIERFGGQAEITLLGDIPAPIARIAAGHGFRRAVPAEDAPEPDLVVVVDTGSRSQLDAAAEWVFARQSKTLVIDHHLRGDLMAAHRLIEPSCASTTQLILRMFDESRAMRPEQAVVPLDELGMDLAEPLFIGLATDTGWFRHSNAGPEVFADVARLLACGVDRSRLYREIEETHPVARLRLEAAALRSLELGASDRFALMLLRAGDFKEAGGDPSMLSGVVNMPLIAASVQAVALLVEAGPNRIKVSLRSKSGPGGAPSVDVNVLAGRFGGGGHAQAAGARLAMSPEEACAAMRAALMEALVDEVAPSSEG